MTTETADSAVKPPALISVPATARLVGVSVATAYRMAAAGQLPVIRLGGTGSMRVIRSQLLEEYGIVESPRGEAPAA